MYRYSLSSAPHAYDRLSRVLKDPAISSSIACGIKTTVKHNLAVAGHLFSSNHSSSSGSVLVGKLFRLYLPCFSSNDSSLSGRHFYAKYLQTSHPVIGSFYTLSVLQPFATQFFFLASVYL